MGCRRQECEDGSTPSGWAPGQTLPSCLVSLFSKLTMLCEYDWLSVSQGSPSVASTSNRRGKYWGKNYIRIEYHTWFFFSYLFSLSSMVQPRLHGLYIALDMKVIERWIRMSRRMDIGSMQILWHCKKDFVLYRGGDTWTPSSTGHQEVAVFSQNLQLSLWLSSEVADGGWNGCLPLIH